MLVSLVFYSSYSFDDELEDHVPSSPLVYVAKSQGSGLGMGSPSDSSGNCEVAVPQDTGRDPVSVPAPSESVLDPVDPVTPPPPPPPVVQSVSESEEVLEEVLNDVFLEDVNPSVLWCNICEQVEYYRKL